MCGVWRVARGPAGRPAVHLAVRCNVQYVHVAGVQACSHLSMCPNITSICISYITYYHTTTYLPSYDLRPTTYLCDLRQL